ncbi:nitroreductase family deazaflavin-dependent oxidoreductase [Gordonia sp. VNK21]|uniref:nitroreductase family deazaflavin-dependent oxidoreductase n=1 Tax=Gordonia sp. VNK21 TaxID=3382483 RepID=UPI0038D4CC94
MKVPRFVATANKYVANPLQRLWADKLPPWAVVEHVGRRSGTQYSTPVLAWVEGGKLSIPLVYGTESDWVRNVLAAGEFTLVRAGSRLTVTGARIVPPDSPDIVGLARYLGRGLDGVLYGRIAGGRR